MSLKTKFKSSFFLLILTPTITFAIDDFKYNEHFVELGKGWKLHCKTPYRNIIPSWVFVSADRSYNSYIFIDGTLVGRVRTRYKVTSWQNGGISTLEVPKTDIHHAGFYACWPDPTKFDHRQYYKVIVIEYSHTEFKLSADKSLTLAMNISYAGHEAPNVKFMCTFSYGELLMKETICTKSVQIFCKLEKKFHLDDENPTKCEIVFHNNNNSVKWNETQLHIELEKELEVVRRDEQWSMRCGTPSVYPMMWIFQTYKTDSESVVLHTKWEANKQYINRSGQTTAREAILYCHQPDIMTKKRTTNLKKFSFGSKKFDIQLSNFRYHFEVSEDRRVYNMKIPRVDLDHSGTYMCAHKSSEKLIERKIDLLVVDEISLHKVLNGLFFMLKYAGTNVYNPQYNCNPGGNATAFKSFNCRILENNLISCHSTVSSEDSANILEKCHIRFLDKVIITNVTVEKHLEIRLIVGLCTFLPFAIVAILLKTKWKVPQRWKDKSDYVTSPSTKESHSLIESSPISIINHFQRAKEQRETLNLEEADISSQSRTPMSNESNSSQLYKKYPEKHPEHLKIVNKHLAWASSDNLLIINNNVVELNKSEQEHKLFQTIKKFLDETMLHDFWFEFLTKSIRLGFLTDNNIEDLIENKDWLGKCTKAKVCIQMLIRLLDDKRAKKERLEYPIWNRPRNLLNGFHYCWSKSKASSGYYDVKSKVQDDVDKEKRKRSESAFIIVKKIILCISSGGNIEGMSVTYNSGNEYKHANKNVNFPGVGNKTSKLKGLTFSTISFHDDEFITKVDFKCAKSINSLTFQTNLDRKFGPYGEDVGREGCSTPSKPGGFLAGIRTTFFGRQEADVLSSIELCWGHVSCGEICSETDGREIKTIYDINGPTRTFRATAICKFFITI
ncbi:hypothetical protein HELRODRAFT_183629 [Helobdella robusta]|uniref:Jacalin-type lectin domain-containing protein n=1 Tax=Helobdella robusta TaxID=6412 RepID=T1FJY7_HELRO|nr:hypothetical protein HELRODRAFT_183629 [Helobdella robusta]ESO10408.1 hypothetical protein HELRODRAFT_183629 [Helobdella robusta]